MVSTRELTTHMTTSSNNQNRKAQRLFDYQMAALLVFGLCVFPSTAAVNLPTGFIVGAYEIMGRLPTASGRSYSGWVRVIEENDSLQVVRCVDGQYSESEARLSTKTPDKIPALEMNFRMAGALFASTCAIYGDFDNLPRLMCMTTPTNEPNVSVPGIESLFPIVWPVAMNYFDCE